MRNTIQPLMIGLFVSFVLAACGGPAAPTPTPVPSDMTLVDPPKALIPFTLTSSANAPFTADSFKGKVTVLTFGYTHCPDVCPITLGNFTQVKKILGNDASQVNFMFVSVDGKRDTPAVLAKHLKLFDKSFIGLTGVEADVNKLTTQFGVEYEIGQDAATNPDYLVSHTASSFLVDKQGRLSRVYSYGMLPQFMASDIREVLGKSGDQG